MSVIFNATTSKAENAASNVLNSAKTVTVAVWTYGNGLGGGNFGHVFCMDEVPGTAQLILRLVSANVMRIDKGPGGAGTLGGWSFAYPYSQWNGVAFSYDFTSTGDTPDPIVRVNFSTYTVGNGLLTEFSTPNSVDDQPATGYCIGNRTAGDRGWDGRLSHFQVWNRILSEAEMDQALLSPGTVRNSLRLYIPLTHATDLTDGAGLGFTATGTALATGADGFPQGSGGTNSAIFGGIFSPLLVGV